MNTKYATEECLQAYYDSLEKQLAEKEAMIDWLAGMCRAFCESQYYCNECINYSSGCPIVL